MTSAAAAGLRLTADLDPDLWIGLVLLAAGGALSPLARRAPLLLALLAVPGAWWVTQVVAAPGGRSAAWLLLLWIIAGASLVSTFDGHFCKSGYGPVLIAISVAGMFTTLPDTEEILVVFGAVVPVALLAWPKPWASLGAVGIYPLLGLLACVIAQGGRGRESSIVGAAACLALLTIDPVARWWRNRTALDLLPARWWRVPLVATVQLVVVLLMARVAGLAPTASRAFAISFAVALVSAAILAMSVTARRSQGVS